MIEPGCPTCVYQDNDCQHEPCYSCLTDEGGRVTGRLPNYSPLITPITMPKQTNWDRIRAMAVEEFAVMYMVLTTRFGTYDREELLEWLQEEAEE